MKEPHKHLCSFIRGTIGYSPGGEFSGNDLILNRKKIDLKTFSKLTEAWENYRLQWPETELPKTNFVLSYDLTFEEKQVMNGLSPTTVGDTTFWK